MFHGHRDMFSKQLRYWESFKYCVCGGSTCCCWCCCCCFWCDSRCLATILLSTFPFETSSQRYLAFMVARAHPTDVLDGESVSRLNKQISIMSGPGWALHSPLYWAGDCNGLLVAHFPLLALFTATIQSLCRTDMLFPYRVIHSMPTEWISDLVMGSGTHHSECVQ